MTLFTSEESSSVGSFKSSLVEPSSHIKVTKPSPAISIRLYSVLTTMGTSAEAAVEIVSSCFLLVKISIPVMEALAAPCLPVLAVERSTT